VTVKNSNSTIIEEFNNEMTDEIGRGAPLDIQFQEAGPSIVSVCIPAGASSTRISCADLIIVVILEFPTTHAILVMAGTIGTTILLCGKYALNLDFGNLAATKTTTLLKQ
jgi:hypothetical protein